MTLAQSAQDQKPPSTPTIHPVGARPAVVLQDKGHSYFVDVATGEIIHATRKLPKRRAERVIKVDVGVDTRWPSEARDAAELHAAITPFEHWPDDHYVSGKKLLDLLDAQVSDNAVRLLRYLAENLVGRNHWFGRMDDLIEATQMKPRTLERALSELYAINAVQRKSHGQRWPVRFSVHPWYAWKGDILGRDHACAEWVRNRSATFGGQ